MAEAYLRVLGGANVAAASAGTIAADAPDPSVVTVMAEDGIDISAARPKLLDNAVMERADRILTMGCDVEGVPRIDADWGLQIQKVRRLNVSARSAISSKQRCLRSLHPCETVRRQVD